MEYTYYNRLIFSGWLGYIMIDTKLKAHGVILIMLGALMSAYHVHLWFNKKH